MNLETEAEREPSLLQEQSTSVQIYYCYSLGRMEEARGCPFLSSPQPSNAALKLT